MRGRTGAAVLTLALLAACSSGDDSADETTIASQTSSDTTAPSTTAAPMTSAAPPTTSTTAPPTTAPSTTAGTTTVAPTTTDASTDTTVDMTDEVAAFEAVVQAAEQSWVVYTTALMHPEDDEAVGALESVYTERLVSGFLDIVDEYQANDFRLIESDAVRSSQEIELSSVAVNLDSGTATLQACVVDSFVKVQRLPDGTDEIVDDGVSRRVEELGVLRVDGIWKVDTARVPEESEQLTSCD